MKFDKDVFISYAHLDDKPLDEGTRGWITDFHKLLQTRLEQTIGHELNIWRDERLSGNEVFAPEIAAQFPKMKIMVSIITPRYVNSDWCKRELDEFYKAAARNGGVSIDNKSRIFKVVKTPIDKDVIESLPGELHKIFDEILDYKFYIQEAATGKFKELGRGKWTDNAIQQEFMNKLDDVVQDMANLIKKIDKSENTREVKRKIYLAETTYDLQSYRDNLVRELQEAGFMVLPSKNLPYVIDRFTADVEGFIDQSILSLHLISSTNYAIQPEGSDKSTVILQNEIAALKSATRNFNRLIWIPPVTAEASTNQKMISLQRAFVEELKHNTDHQRGADILEGSLEEFKQAIFDTIRRMDAEEKARQEAKEREAKMAGIIQGASDADPEGQVPRLVYLICDPRDLDETRPLEDLITDNGHEVLLPLFDGDQAQLRQAHLDNLKMCDAVIIYYGTGNYRWTSSMKSDLLRLPALGRTKPLMSKAIYLAGPSDKDKETFRANDFIAINGLAGFDPGLFKAFIQKIK
ncbi:MAG: TIR domain-containing protein [Williamsia sp.]|nr:TIR domain-containing protein [Williamsia sp.]